MFCPACGAERLRALPNNSPVGDFVCDACAEEFELKARKGALGPKILDGAYGAMMSRLKARNNPSLMAMSYDRAMTGVTDLIVVPKHVFTPEIIEKKNPTLPRGRSNPWIGCHILIGQVPLSGRIPLITRGAHVPKVGVLDRWRSTLFLRDASLNARGWLLAVMMAVEAVDKAEFDLDDVYAHEAALSALYPGNHNVRPRSGSSCRSCAIAAGWNSPPGAGRIGGSSRTVVVPGLSCAALMNGWATSSPSAMHHPHDVPHLFWRRHRTGPKPGEGAAMENGISRRGAQASGYGKPAARAVHGPDAGGHPGARVGDAGGVRAVRDAAGGRCRGADPAVGAAGRSVGAASAVPGLSLGSGIPVHRAGDVRSALHAAWLSAPDGRGRDGADGARDVGRTAGPG